MAPHFYAVITVMAATLSIIVIIYILLLFGWCGFSARLPHPSPSAEEKNNSGLSPYIASTFKYQKGIENEKAEAAADSEPGECAVCLTGFKDGDNVCQLPRCSHSFHSPCVDMWLNSHSDCPLCRASVDRIDSGGLSSTSTVGESSREVLLDIRIFS